MPRIQVLDKHVAELIAAGEVVERPSSVIKELIENSIDAGATEITVEISNGGISYMRITDNGCGIAREDVPTAFLRHATSKVSGESDLEHIGTLGFRGEALASIAAVSRVEMLTCQDGAEAGTLYHIDGGEEVSIGDAGCPKGTTIIIRDIFYNTPARMKFLKKDVSEGNAVAGVIDRIALSHPEISVRFIREGKRVLMTPGDGDLRAAVYAVFGREFASGLIPVDYTVQNMRISGFVSAPIAARKSRQMQFFYINGRFVKSNTMFAALEQAYKGSIMVGKFPACVLNLSIPFNQVDINVHPAKIEVRFSDERPVFNTVYYGVKTALQTGDVRPELKLDKAVSTAKPLPEIEQLSLHNAKKPIHDNSNIKQAQRVAREFLNQLPKAPESKPLQTEISTNHVGVMRNSQIPQYNSPVSKLLDIIVDDDDTPIKDDVPTENVQEKISYGQPSATKIISDNQNELISDDSSGEHALTGGDQVDITLIGEAFATYVIAQHGDQLIFIDKHAAHERMLYEKIKGGAAESQLLIEPVAVTLSKEESGALLENSDAIAGAGFEIDDFGGSSVLVRAVPMVLCDENIGELITEIAAGFADSRHTVQIERLDWLYHNIACRAAVKAGNRSSDADMLALARVVVDSGEIRYCPHGRPVAFILTKKELEKQFGRQG